MEISQKSLMAINQEVRSLQQAAQKLKGTPDYDLAQKSYQQKLNDLAEIFINCLNQQTKAEQ